MNNYKVTVREVREWIFTTESESMAEAKQYVVNIVRSGEPPHLDYFEDPVAYEVKHIPITHEHNQERP